MSPAASPPTFDALVVGAGWAGLTCALRLSHAGKRVLCVEARQRLGGRAFTHTWNDDTAMDNTERTIKVGETGHAVDFGCSYIHGYNEGNPLKEIARKFGVHVHVPAPTSASIIAANGVLPSALSERLQANLKSAQQAAKARGKELRYPTDDGPHSVGGRTSLASVILESSSSPLYWDLKNDEERTLARSFARSMHIPLGVELERVACEYFGVEASFAGTDGVPEGGFSRLIEKMAEETEKNGGQIRRGEAVSKMQADGGGESVHVVTRSADAGQEHRYIARTAVVTVPLAVLQAKSNLFEPPLEAERQDAIRRTTVGNLNKVLLTYEQSWWPAETGTFFVLPGSVADASSTMLEQLLASTTLIVSSLSAPNGLPAHMSSPSLLVMVGGVHGKQLESFERVRVAEALHAYLAPRLSGDANAAAKNPVRHTFYSRWSRQPWTGGATSSPSTLGNAPNDFHILSKATWDNRLHFAGEHCSYDHRGSIAGAVVTGEAAADAVLQHLNAQARM